MARRSGTLPSIEGNTFGDYLRLLRRRVRLTQTQLGIAVGYSDAQICRLEMGKRLPDLTTVVALFFPALDLDARSPEAQRLLELAAAIEPTSTSAALPLSIPPSATPPPTVTVLSPMLPTPPTSFVGRARELNTVVHLLRQGESRLITLLGSAGIGKTRLALQVAHHVQPYFPDGVWFVDLTAVESAEFVPPAVAHTIGLESEEDPANAVQQYLRPRKVLLVLDNMEQVRGVGALLAKWLTATPGLTLLVTSRIALRLSAEQTFPVPPLALPDLAHLPPPEQLAQVESVALLLARLRTVTPDLTLTPANTLPIAAICVRVDGVPLALELVAAHGRLFTPQELLTEIARQFVRLRRRGTDTPARHQSVTAALAWSRAQLPLEVQILFARLSIFANGWTVEGAVAVCDLEEMGRTAILEGLEELLDHSLIQRQVVGEGTRFTMLAMVRAYAQEQIEGVEKDALPQRMAAYYVRLADSFHHHFEVGGNQMDSVVRVAAETDNLRAVLTWAVASGTEEVGFRLVGALARFWFMRGQVREGQDWMEALLATSRDGIAPEVLANAFNGAGLLAYRQSDHLQAEGWYRKALTLYEQVHSQAGKADILRKLGLLEDARGDMQAATPYFEASLVLYRQLGDEVRAAQMLHNLGNMANQQNDFERALDYYRQTLAVYHRVGDESGISLVLLGAGVISRDLGNTEQAQAELRESLDIATRLGDSWTAAVAQLNLGDLAADRGNYGEAQRLLIEALAAFETIGDQQLICNVQTRLGSTLLLEGDVAGAIRYYRQSLMLANGLGYDGGITEGVEGLAACMAERHPTIAARLFGFAAMRRRHLSLPVAVADQPRLHRAVHLARNGLTPAAWQKASKEGEALTAAQAVKMALATANGSGQGVVDSERK